MRSVIKYPTCTVMRERDAVVERRKARRDNGKQQRMSHADNWKTEDAGYNNINRNCATDRWLVDATTLLLALLWHMNNNLAQTTDSCVQIRVEIFV